MEKNILYIDANIRYQSRTKALSDYLVSKLDGNVKHLHLPSIKLPELNDPTLSYRFMCCKNRDFSSPMFDFAKDFAAADYIVLSAPFWDASFPASVKEYLETISVNHITFEYLPDGTPKGLAKAKCLYYVTTAGGYITDNSFGYGYLRSLAVGMFGVEDTKMFKAEGLDIRGTDVASALAACRQEIDAFFK